MSERRGPWHHFAGARLPIAPSPPKSTVPCDRDAGHVGGIRFELHRYGRKVGAIRLCGSCIRSFLDDLPPDPLDATGAA